MNSFGSLELAIDGGFIVKMKRPRTYSRRWLISGGVWIPRLPRSLVFIFIPLFIQMSMYFLCRTLTTHLETFNDLQIPKICWRTRAISSPFSITQWILTFFWSAFSFLFFVSHKKRSFFSSNLTFDNRKLFWTHPPPLRFIHLVEKFSSFSKSKI